MALISLSSVKWLTRCMQPPTLAMSRCSRYPSRRASSPHSTHTPPWQLWAWAAVAAAAAAAAAAQWWWHQ